MGAKAPQPAPNRPPVEPIRTDIVPCDAVPGKKVEGGYNGPAVAGPGTVKPPASPAPPPPKK